MNLEKLARRLTIELHLDIPDLGDIVKASIDDVYGRDLPIELHGDAIADQIEDRLAHLGNGLHRHLNGRALDDWRPFVRSALDKAMAGSNDR